MNGNSTYWHIDILRKQGRHVERKTKETVDIKEPIFKSLVHQHANRPIPPNSKFTNTQTFHLTELQNPCTMQVMRKRKITSKDPGEFTLAADARCTSTNYINDHIWELRYRNIEPLAFAIHTTYGLRARSFHIFPCFTEDEVTIIDPADFDSPPTIHSFGPNFATMSYCPLPGIMVDTYYCVPGSNVIGGKIRLINNKLKYRELNFEVAAVLIPDERGKRMAARKINEVSVLTGQTHNLHPVLFITGGAREGTGTFPSLTFDLELAPGANREFTWAVAALEEEEASFQLARTTATHHWEAEIARGELLAESKIIVKTGNHDWDTAFALAQKTAFGLLMSPTTNFPGTSFVVNRHPSQGFSARGDGRDYQLNWSGQTPLQTDYLSGLLASTAPELAQDLLMNFLAFQSKEGFIPKKVGLGGQESDQLSMPLMCNMAWRIFQSTQSKEFLKEVFPKLKAFVLAWFTPDQDSDKDGIPEWIQARQSGFEAHPASINNPNWGLHPEVSMTEEPALCALLSNELHILTQMANLIGEESAISTLQALKKTLERAIHEAWDEESSLYYRWDRDTHFSPVGKTLATETANGTLSLQMKFEHPVRFLIQIEAANSLPSKLHVFIHGYETLEKHSVEHITPNQFHWHLKTGKAMSQSIYSFLEYVDVNGLEEGDKITIQVANYRTEDISLLLPLWSGDTSPANARKLIQETITDPQRFWFPFGLRSTPHEERPTVLMPWNAMIGKGLIANNRRDLAAKLVSKLMKAIIKNLKENGRFYTCYDAETGQGLQEHNTVDGLAPLELFLETLGVRIISPHRIAGEGRNPFPWPVTITFRGTSIRCRKRRTTITFADGQTAVITDPKPQIVYLE